MSAIVWCRTTYVFLARVRIRPSEYLYEYFYSKVGGFYSSKIYHKSIVIVAKSRMSIRTATRNKLWEIYAFDNHHPNTPATLPTLHALPARAIHASTSSTTTMPATPSIHLGQNTR